MINVSPAKTINYLSLLFPSDSRVYYTCPRLWQYVMNQGVESKIVIV